MITNLEQFYQNAKIVMEKLDIFFEQTDLVSVVRADHICFKCESSEEFERMRALFENNSSYILQSIISKRRIAIVKLQTQIETVCGPISVLELSDQKPDNSQKSGFEHIEIYPIKNSIEEIVKIIQDKGIAVEKESKPHHTTWDFVADGFKIRIEPEALVEKIKREEMVA